MVKNNPSPCWTSRAGRPCTRDACCREPSPCKLGVGLEAGIWPRRDVFFPRLDPSPCPSCLKMLCAWECCLETRRRKSFFIPFRRTLLFKQEVPLCDWMRSPAEGVGESIRPEDCEEVSWAGQSIGASWRLITESEIYFIALKCVPWLSTTVFPEIKVTKAHESIVKNAFLYLI